MIIYELTRDSVRGYDVYFWDIEKETKASWITTTKRRMPKTYGPWDKPNPGVFFCPDKLLAELRRQIEKEQADLAKNLKNLEDSVRRLTNS